MTLNPADELLSVSVQYQTYLTLAGLTEIPVDGTAVTSEFYEPRPAPLTLTLTRA